MRSMVEGVFPHRNPCRLTSFADRSDAGEEKGLARCGAHRAVVNHYSRSGRAAIAASDAAVPIVVVALDVAGEIGCDSRPGSRISAA